MTELFMKTKDINTLGEKRLEAIQSGQPLVAQYGSYSGYGHRPHVEAVGVSYQPELASMHGTIRDSELINSLNEVQLYGGANITRMANFLDIRMQGFGGRTPRQAFADGTLDQLVEDAKMRSGRTAQMDGNSLLENWSTLVDAARIQLTINKALNPTVREFIYSVLDRPNASAIENVNEFFEDAVIFEENDGTGEQVEMGEMRGGQIDTVSQRIFAAGMTYDLNKYLFDTTLDMNKVNRAVALGEAAKKDDTSLAPIINFTYSGGQQTAADTTGATPEEKRYLTLKNALTDITKRRDPVTQDRIIPSGCVLLCHPLDAIDVMEVVGGFPNVSQNVKVRQPLSQISRVIGYEGARIPTRSQGVKTYTDLTQYTAYLIVPNRRMFVSRKRPLQLNIDANPEVLRLAREQMAWWYCEGVYNDGIGYYIQEVTLPS